MVDPLMPVDDVVLPTVDGVVVDDEVVDVDFEPWWWSSSWWSARERRGGGLEDLLDGGAPSGVTEQVGQRSARNELDHGDEEERDHEDHDDKAGDRRASEDRSAVGAMRVRRQACDWPSARVHRRPMLQPGALSLRARRIPKTAPRW